MLRKLGAVIGLGIAGLCAVSSVQAQIKVKQFTGTLEKGDKTFEDGSLLDGYALGIREGQSFSVSASADGFAFQVIIVGPDGKFLSTTDGEQGKGVTVEVRAEPGKGGKYEVLFAGKSPDQKGNYLVEFTSTAQIVDVIAGPDGKEMTQGGGAGGIKNDSGNDSGESGKSGGGWIHNKLEDSDDPYAGRQYRNDVYVLPLKLGDVLGAQIVTDGFIPELMSGWEGGPMNGPREDGRKVEPDNEAAISLVGATRAGNYRVSVLSEHSWKADGKYNYKIRFNINGRILEAPAGITAKGGEGPGDVQIDTSKFAALTPMNGDGSEEQEEEEEGNSDEPVEGQTDDGESFRISANGFVDRYNVSSRYTAKDPQNVIGPPDGEKYSYTQRNGSGEWEFVDNVLINGPGIDLVVYSIKPGDEKYQVEISADGREWIDLGTVEGAVKGFDISSHNAGSGEFRYVKIIDKSNGKGAAPGPDIDAIGAVNSRDFQPQITDLITPENLEERGTFVWTKNDQLDEGDDIGHYGAKADYYRIAFTPEQLNQLETVELRVELHPNLPQAPEFMPGMRLFEHWTDQDILTHSDPNPAVEFEPPSSRFLKMAFHKNSIKGAYHLAVYPSKLQIPSGAKIPYLVKATGFDKSGNVVTGTNMSGADPGKPKPEPATGPPEKIEVEVLGIYFPEDDGGDRGFIRDNVVEVYGTMSINALKENPTTGERTAVSADGGKEARVIDKPRNDNLRIRVDSLIQRESVASTSTGISSLSAATKKRGELLRLCHETLNLKRTFTVPDSSKNGSEHFIVSLRSHFTEKDVRERNDDEWGFSKRDINLNRSLIWEKNGVAQFGTVIHEGNDELPPLHLIFSVSRPGTFDSGETIEIRNPN